MRSSFINVTEGWQHDTETELKHRLSKLEQFIPLEEDEIEIVNAMFKYWMMMLEAKELKFEGEVSMKKPSPEKEAARERKREVKRAKAEEWLKADKALTIMTIIAALVVGFMLGWMAHMLDIMWLFQ